MHMTDLPPLLRLESLGDHRYQALPELDAATEEPARNVIFGGQILAQAIMAADLDRGTERPNDKEVKSIHAIFARAGDYTEPIVYEVDRMHDGRTLGSDTVTLAQGGKVMSRAMLLWSKDEPDLLRHTAHIAMPDVAGPDDPAGRQESLVFPGAECQIVGGVNVWDPGQPAQAAELDVWTRFDADLAIVAAQAVLSWATDGWLIGASMLPYADVDQSQAHRTISTGVIAHTLNFHDRFRSDEWLLLANESIWAGRGRTHGRCNIWTSEGKLVATYTQDNLVRSFGDQQDHSSEYRRVM
jgi:acyl-CoA thioesterase